MIHFTPHMRILVATTPVDLRKGFDSLSGYCRDYLQSDPLSGCVFVFCNRVRTHLRLLFYDGQGMWMATKRLSQGRFPWWPGGGGGAAKLRSLDQAQSEALIWGGNGDQVKILAPWRHIS
jgi:transposase